ncbi:MAG: cyclic-di-AMP receptor [Anaerolineales bacterium]|nr:cyclic-di-AMP receptor [Anaerolineales bacterium]MCB9146838.1 cyclic-di-AMP receptor [Anaerolineales bacterium]
MQPTDEFLLVVAVIQEQDFDPATKALHNIGASLTYLASAGGFLGRRNTTLLVGMPSNRLQDALNTLHEVCRQRVEYMTLPMEGSPMPMPAPVPVTVGGATVFALPVERFEQI